MYSNLSFITAGEFTPPMGIVNYLNGNAIPLSSYDKLEELRIATVKFKLQYLLDYVDTTEVMFDTMPSEQRNMISQLCYGQKIFGVVNMESATAKMRMDSSSIRFEDPGEGYVAILHTMLRKGLMETKPIEMVLGRIHISATKFMYTTIIRSFDKYYSLMGKSEDDLAKIRYACAYITGCKLFKLNTDANSVAIPLTQMMFNRVNVSKYETNEDLSTYNNMVSYLSDSKILEGLNVGTFVEAFIRQLGSRCLPLMECGVDFVNDVLLSKSVGRLIPRNLYRLVGERDCEIIARNIAATFNTGNKNVKENVKEVPSQYRYNEPPKEEEQPEPEQQQQSQPEPQQQYQQPQQQQPQQQYQPIYQTPQTQIQQQPYQPQPYYNKQLKTKEVDKK